MNKKGTLKILVLNLMPDKAKTQAQLNIFFKRSPCQIQATFCYPATHHFKNQKSLADITNYQSFPQVAEQFFDGLIITGAAVEKLKFEEVDYWDELCQIYQWSQLHCRQVLSICWAAQAGMYFFGRIQKHLTNKKIFGIYPVEIEKSHPLFNGLKQTIDLPFSRYTTNWTRDFVTSNLKILAASKTTGPAICETQDQQQLFITGHPEYQLHMLADEYYRDLKLKRQVDLPKNYFDQQRKNQIKGQWLVDCRILFNNWFNQLAKISA